VENGIDVPNANTIIINSAHNYGLSDLLRGKGLYNAEFQTYLMENWYVLPSGNIPPNPSELLGSGRMAKLLAQLREMFDYIVIDLPPVNLVSDALSVASLISGMLVVIREEHTEKKELERCFQQLKLSNVKLLGFVMNDAQGGSGSYGKYKRYQYE
jgi:capsular exopolysaccharide synthesis family protein